MRTIAIDWGAWGEMGMASRGHIPALMERAGIEMLPPAQAAALVRAELQNPASNSEVLLAGSLGLMEAAQHADGGLDAERANAALRAGNPIHQMFSQVTRYDAQDGVILEADVDPTIEPFLRDHALNGIPVLPGVIGIEGFSVAARHIASVLASDKQGFIVSQLEDVQFKLPFKFYRNETRRITWKARVIAEQRGLVVYASLESTHRRQDQRLEVLEHFTGRVILEHAGVETQAHVTAAPHWNGNATVGSDDIYRLYFHGPAFQVLEGVQSSGDTVLGRLNKNLPPATSDGRRLSTPTLVELCFQTAGIYEAGATGVLALPQSIGSLHIYRDDIRDTPIFAEVTPLHAKDGSLSFNARVLDENGNIYLEIKNYHTSPLPYAAEPGLIAPLKVLLQ
jgi:3-hydroxymyristoyl/3-hydroxydecanoyl-(acyl carrier protein) dehydratase